MYYKANDENVFPKLLKVLRAAVGFRAGGEMEDSKTVHPRLKGTTKRSIQAGKEAAARVLQQASSGLSLSSSGGEAIYDWVRFGTYYIHQVSVSGHQFEASPDSVTHEKVMALAERLGVELQFQSKPFLDQPAESAAPSGPPSLEAKVRREIEGDGSASIEVLLSLQDMITSMIRKML